MARSPSAPPRMPGPSPRPETSICWTTTRRCWISGVPVRVRGAVRADLRVRPRPPGCRHRAAGRLHPDRCAHAGDGRPRPPAAATGDRRPVPSGRNSRAWGGAGRRKAGAADFIEKPYDDQVLLATVRAESLGGAPRCCSRSSCPSPIHRRPYGRGLPCALPPSCFDAGTSAAPRGLRQRRQELWDRRLGDQPGRPLGRYGRATPFPVERGLPRDRSERALAARARCALILVKRLPAMPRARCEPVLRRRPG